MKCCGKSIRFITFDFKKSKETYGKCKICKKYYVGSINQKEKGEK